MHRRASCLWPSHLGLTNALLVCLLPAVVRAQANPTPSDLEAARAEFEAASKLAGAGKWNEAEQAFRRSLALTPRTRTRYNLAVALHRQGKTAECLTVLDQVLREGDPVLDRATLDRARALRQQALQEVARLRLSVFPATLHSDRSRGFPTHGICPDTAPMQFCMAAMQH